MWRGRARRGRAVVGVNLDPGSPAAPACAVDVRALIETVEMDELLVALKAAGKGVLDAVLSAVSERSLISSANFRKCSMRFRVMRSWCPTLLSRQVETLLYRPGQHLFWWTAFQIVLIWM